MFSNVVKKYSLDFHLSGVDIFSVFVNTERLKSKLYFFLIISKADYLFIVFIDIPPLSTSVSYFDQCFKSNLCKLF